MKKFLVLPWLMVLLAISPAHSQNELSVVLETSPPAGQIGPDQTYARTTLSVIDASGQPVPNAYLKLHLDAPPGNAFISTDFPIVEGSPLLEIEGILPQGVLAFDYIYPIRGTYNFEVEAGREAARLTFKDTLPLKLSENPNEIANFALFFAILLGLGIVAGFIIGRGARAQQLASPALALLLAAGLTGGALSPVRAHGGGTVSSAASFTESATEGDITVTYAMNPGAGRVGTLNTLNFTARHTNSDLIPQTTFRLELWHIEDEKPVFATTLFAPTGQTKLRYQFFDGAEHEVRLAAQTPTGSAALAKVIEVEGLSPPLPVKIKTTVYLVLITFIGILIGLRIQMIQGKKQQFAPARA